MLGVSEKDQVQRCIMRSAIDALGQDNDSDTERAPSIAKLTAVLAVAIFATSTYANLPHALGLKQLCRVVPPFDGRDLSMMDHLGGEHRSVAAALSSGRGFADPFNEPTGPTAWVAPVLPTVQAVFLAVGGMPLTVPAIALLHNMSLIFTGWLVLRTAARCRWSHAPVVSLVLFLGTTWTYFSSSYQFTHDTWLIMFLVGVLVYLTDRLWTSSFGPATAIGWGLLGGVAILSGPVLGPVWFTLTALLARSTRRIRTIIISLLIAAGVMTPWIIRNAVVFGRLIPVKSNLFFEIHQSNVLERDGVLSHEVGDTHPFRTAGVERSRYRMLGEMAYLDEYRTRTVEAIGRNPFGYVTMVKNRLLAATLFFHSFTKNEAKREVLIRSLLHPLPFLGLMVVVLARGWARDRVVLIALVVYAVYLIPYLLVAYYRRYAMPLVGLQVMFEIWALDALRGLLFDLAAANDVRSSPALSPIASLARGSWNRWRTSQSGSRPGKPATSSRRATDSIPQG
jgi:hypothetical protein